MSFFFFIVLAGFVWMGLRGDLSVTALAFGALLGAIFWRIEGARSRQSFSPLRALRLAGAGARAFVLFAWELLVANGQQLRVVLAPRVHVTPQWVHFSTDLESAPLRALLGVMISLTPGTLICDEIEEGDRLELWIHVLDGDDPEAVIARIRSRLEAPLRALEAP